MDNLGCRVYCILGDGEIEEGQIWEAAMTSNKYKLDNLCVILDNNGLQIDGKVEEVKALDCLYRNGNHLDLMLFHVMGIILKC